MTVFRILIQIHTYNFQKSNHFYKQFCKFANQYNTIQRKMIHKFSKYFLLLIFISVSSLVFSQHATVRGFVYETETGEPVMFANVFMKGTTIGTTTDENGYFIITKVPAGDYNFVVTFIGYDTVSENITLKQNENLQKKVFLAKAAQTLGAVQVSAEYTAKRTEIRASVQKVTPRLIKQMPSVGGQADLAQYLQILPGVVFTGDQGGQLYIRGGSPIQNKVQLDGMVIYNPFHSIGLFSVFETDLLRTADIYSGGFGADKGGRISAVMDLSTRDGNKKRLSGKVGASTFGANLLLEGPIIKQSDNNGGTSFILSYKNSYLSESSKIFYKYIDKDGLPFNFSDLYGKVSMNAKNGSKINLFGFNYSDNVKYKAVSDFKWNSFGVGSNFVIIPGTLPVMVDGNVAYSTYNIEMHEKGFEFPRKSSIGGFNASLGITSFMGKSELKTGIEMLGFSTDFSYTNVLKLTTKIEQFTTEIAPYIQYKAALNKFLIESGLRVQYYASHSHSSLEPRLALKYLASDKIRFKLASGIYSQNFIATSSDRDVVNLFYGFLSGPDNLPEYFDGKERKHKLQKAEHIVAGVEYDPTNYITLNLEGYLKNLSQMTNMNRNKIYPDATAYSDKPEELRKDFIYETGVAKGIDLSFKYDKNNVYLWAVYSLAYVTKFDGFEHYSPHYDRRHNITMLGVYKFGRFEVWEVNCRWNYGSGFPFTRNQGQYEQLLLPDITTDLLNENGTLGTILGGYNKGRLSDYHRMDIGATRKFILSENSSINVNLTITNVYSRKNIFYVNRITQEKVYQLPLMPSLGVNWVF